MKGALASGFATDQLHHSMGHDLKKPPEGGLERAGQSVRRRLRRIC
jgi:hypothetical protein